MRDPKCDKCGAPVTTGLMPVLCHHARNCAFVEDDQHWQSVEDFRKFFDIKRAKPADGVGAVDGGKAG